MMKYAAAAALALCTFGSVNAAKADGTVECHSRNFQYGECWAGPLRKPQLIYQTSSSPCILNRSWGYNPKSRYIWVAQGCAAVFGDAGGYHHGRGDTFDPDARQYGHRGHDVGAMVAGVVVDALVAGMLGDHGKHHHSASNYAVDSGYNGCHGVGCGVDNPDAAIDTRPQFDKSGEPNFDTHGNYQGCHGVGCLVDDPDAE